jgi:hypothetical protein
VHAENGATIVSLLAIAFLVVGMVTRRRSAAFPGDGGLRRRRP